ncbi:glucosamine 6-phosphate N-acetyltransferase-like isoform X2 [Gordionus sp. m RMFG-2023]|uniref:glucosamine 6-phosphate N-acetyltransferase-like isoform X2 n=1 Tax=Gordionus sp. m RMFG-2023 TaxID=3053472 RepID=UPI0031FC532B
MEKPYKQNVFNSQLLNSLSKDLSNELNISSYLQHDSEFHIRPLSIRYISLMSQLTSVGNVDEEMFINNFYSMLNCPDTYYICVIEDTNKLSVIASGTLLIEKKFIHQCLNRGRIEDIVVDKDYRHMKFGKLLVSLLTALSKYLNCYKVSLDCKEALIPFYEKSGYNLDSSNYFMSIRYKD